MRLVFQFELYIPDDIVYCTKIVLDVTCHKKIHLILKKNLSGWFCILLMSYEDEVRPFSFEAHQPIESEALNNGTD